MTSSDFDQLLIRRILDRADADVTMAENGRIAIDLIFVDLQTPIVVLTANDLKEERERCARLAG